MIESVSKYVGIQYIPQCCFDWPMNSITQFKKKVEHFFESVRKRTPCLLHLENIEVFINFILKFCIINKQHI